MRDPSFLALSVHSPIPRRERGGRPPEVRWSAGRATRTNPENLGEPTYPWWAPRGYSPVLAGRRYNFTQTIIDVWHTEPDGRDSSAAGGCDYPHGLALLKHLRHLHIRVPAAREARRWLFTRCSWCGGPSRKRDYVNVSHTWDGPDAKHWWHSEPGLYHHDCSSLRAAHATCTCPDPLLTGRSAYGRCAQCGRHRAGNEPETARHARLIQQTVQIGCRPTPAQRTAIREAWATHNTERHLADTESPL